MTPFFIVYILFIFTSFNASNCFSQNQEIEKENIKKLAQIILDDLEKSKLKSEDLQKLSFLLKDAAKLIQAEDSRPGTDCLKLALDSYLASTTAESATEKAVNTCKKVKDHEVFKFAFENYSKSLAKDEAFESALEGSSKAVRGQLDSIEFIFKKYLISSSNRDALDKTFTQASNLPSDAFPCLKSFFDKYNSSLLASTAMDQTLIDCKK